jgi:F0F1-type ATP synthase epsilon subunit
MSKHLRLIILTPAKTLLETDVLQVQAHLADGAPIGIHPGHAPLLAETLTAPLCYTNASGKHAIDLEAGILQISEGKVTVFTKEAQADQAQETHKEDAHFDQQARDLLNALNAQPDGVLNDETK